MSIGPRDRVVESLLRAGPTGEPSAECLDAETLAAWVDGGLESVPAARAEAHVANCAYCQSVVASIVHVSDAIGAASHANEPAAQPWWHLNIRWLVPLVGAVTAALIWVVVPSQSPTESPRETGVTEASAPTPQESPATLDARQAPAERRRSDAKTTAPPVTGASPVVPLARPAPAQQPTREKEVDRRARDQASAMAKAETPAALEEQAATARRRELEPPPAAAAPAPPAATGALGAAAAMQNRAFAEALPLITSRDAAVQWRVRDGSIVERSVDAGGTWVATEGNAGTGVLAGASPVPAVCWLVGRGGLVRVTSDARTWRRVTAPSVENLVGVDATDERRATVRTASGTAYETADGGATWRRAP